MRYDTRSGYCPTLKRDYSVTVEQLETTNIEDTSRHYIDGQFDCKYAEMHQCPHVNDCPVAHLQK
jgi:hypothetical protein